MKLQSAEEFLKLDPSIRHDDCDHTWDKVIGWMDEYAAQVLNEYKEKLKAEIRHVRSKSNFEISGGVIIQMIDRL